MLEENIQKKERKEKVIILVVGLVAIVLIAFLTNYFVSPQQRVKITEREATAPAVSDETGMSPVQEGRVVTQEGREARYDAEPGSPEAPQQSAPITEEQIPQGSIKMTASMEEGYSPSEFTVRTGDVVTLSITSLDRTYVFKFRDTALSAIALGIGPNETRAITFNAPARGEYEFYCDMPGCPLVGKMIVR